MEQPNHSIRSQSSGKKSSHTVALAIAIGVNVLLGYALSSGLAATLIEKLPDVIKVDVLDEKIPDDTPPPPPPDMAEPPPPFVPPPDFVIQQDVAAPTNTITVQNKVAPPPKYKAKPASVGKPHICGRDYYPSLSQRLGEEGVTTIGFRILVDGTITDIKVVKSSGSDRLDAAALKCAASWRYKPAIGEDGQPAEAPWKAAVEWKLGSR